jgi:NAD-dependent dihydropyrimidine dehydrogenase PreA subunit
MGFTRCINTSCGACADACPNPGFWVSTQEKEARISIFMEHLKVRLMYIQFWYPHSTFYPREFSLEHRTMSKLSHWFFSALSFLTDQDTVLLKNLKADALSSISTEKKISFWYTENYTALLPSILRKIEVVDFILWISIWFALYNLL